jgi:hypothetical protein
MRVCVSVRGIKRERERGQSKSVLDCARATTPRLMQLISMGSSDDERLNQFKVVGFDRSDSRCATSMVCRRKAIDCDVELEID